MLLILFAPARGSATTDSSLAETQRQVGEWENSYLTMRRPIYAPIISCWCREAEGGLVWNRESYVLSLENRAAFYGWTWTGSRDKNQGSSILNHFLTIVGWLLPGLWWAFLDLRCGAGSPALSYILVQPPSLPGGWLIIFTSYTPFFPLHHSSWNSHYLEKEFNFMQQILHSPANSVKASFCSRMMRRIFRWLEVLAAEILVVWET